MEQIELISPQFVIVGITLTYIYCIMKNVVEYQVSSMKDHPHIKKIEVVTDRLVQCIYYPKNLKSDYSKLQYRIKLDLPQNYPQNPPIVKFVDSISHPNICSKTGEVKMPLLMQDWSSYITLYIVIDLLDTLLMQPQTDQKYCPNHKPKGSNNQNVFLAKYNRADSVIQQSVNRGRSCQYEKEERESIEKTMPIQSIKNKLKRMKTIILQKADGEESVQSVQIRGSGRKSENHRKQFTRNNQKLSKISEQQHQQQSKIQINTSGQLQQKQCQPRTTSAKAGNTFFIPGSYNKNIIQSGSSYLGRSRNIQILQKTKSHSKELKKDKIKIPTLRRDTIDQEFIDVLHKDIISTTTLEQNQHQLDKIKKLLNDFYSDYQDLSLRKSTTKSKQLMHIIEQKMIQQLNLIQQLNDLSSLIKKKMIRDVKNYITR